MSSLVLIYGTLVNAAKYAECIGKNLEALSSCVNSSNKIILSDEKKGNLNWMWSARSASDSPRKSVESVSGRLNISEGRVMTQNFGSGRRGREMLAIGYVMKVYDFSNEFVGEIPLTYVPEAREEFQHRLQDLSNTDKRLYDLMTLQCPQLHIIKK